MVPFSVQNEIDQFHFARRRELSLTLCAGHSRIQIFVRDCGGTGGCDDNPRAGGCVCASKNRLNVNPWVLSYAKV